MLPRPTGPAQCRPLIAAPEPVVEHHAGPQPQRLQGNRDERSALRWLARSAGAACQVIYLPVDKDVQLARIAGRQATAPHQTFPMTEADVDQWRKQFQVPDAAELDGGEIPAPPAGWPGWPEWAVSHWPSCTDS